MCYCDVPEIDSKELTKLRKSISKLLKVKNVWDTDFEITIDSDKRIGMSEMALKLRK